MTPKKRKKLIHPCIVGSDSKSINRSMAHSLVPPSISLPTTTPKKIAHLFPRADAQRQQLYSKRCTKCKLAIIYGLSTVAIGLLVSPDNATAAKKRPPPPPPEEKKDLNVSGLQAKIIASKKRKEALKENVAELRESGKPVK